MSQPCFYGCVNQGQPPVPFKVRDRWAFYALAERNESWACYPCRHDAGDVRPEGQFTAKLWLKYCAMMPPYTDKMQKLLTKEWAGPYTAATEPERSPTD
ncbi:hypothetical protein COSO111634_02995 [Corallococcus soli]